jgi:hypothetical protein
MKIRSLLSLNECESYIMHGIDYVEGHPVYHPFYMIDKSKDHLVVVGESCQQIITSHNANNYMLVEATKEEENCLRKSGYKMIGL